ncbi:membrane lipoprotein lipid attachment site-containing protein [Flavobacterium sp. W22_SRS_FP1]|uniref:membrane lipoprotein lipid attachment site-containing protein n=1 Tax=Flavobacterium sp. W22_SRS_FP1 TaxID=3240276 RepID=UPI003F92ED5D
MKKTFYAIFLVLLLASCSGQNSFGKPEVNPIDIQTDFMDWWTYQYNNIMLSRDFVALDANSK